MSVKQKEICPVCHKEKESEPSHASLTSFLFQQDRCICQEGNAASSALTDPGIDSCLSCGMILNRSAGTITSFLFEDLTCNCLAGRSRMGAPEATRSSKSSGKHEKLLSTRFQRNSGLQNSLTERRMQERQSLLADSRAFQELQEGATIGNYELIRRIGQGGMSIVFLAEHTPLNRTCALKFLAPYLVTQSSWLMLQKEARILAGLNHPSICRIYDLGVHKGILPFYAMEFLPGQTLESLLQKRSLSLGSVLEIFVGLADGLSYAHKQGIVHKDIKPANIMLLLADNGETSVKILDFGISELVDPGTGTGKETKLEEIIGTVYYMSPEQLSGAGVDLRCDIYGLGCSLFETLCGEPPYPGMDEKQVIDQHNSAPIPTLRERTGLPFPLDIEAIIRKCLEKNPEDRYQSADQLGADLRAMLSGKPIQFARDARMEAEEEINEASDEEAVPQKPRIGITISPVFSVVLAVACAALGLAAIYGTVTWLVETNSRTDSHLAVKGGKANAAQGKAKGAGEASSSKSKRTADPMIAAKINKLMQLASKTITSNPPRYPETIEYCSQAIALDDSYAMPFLLRGEAKAGLQEDPQGALDDMKKGIALGAPTHQYVPFFMAKAYIDLKMFKEALEQTDKVLADPPGDFNEGRLAEMYKQKGEILFESGRYPEALQALNSGHKVNPKEYWILFDRGQCYLQLKKFHEAQKDFTKAIELKPGEPAAYKARAKVYQALGKPGLARADLNNVDIGVKDKRISKPEIELFGDLK